MNSSKYMKRDLPLIVGLDIGSFTIRIAVGSPGGGDFEDSTHKQVHIVAAVEVPSAGVHRGTISSIEDVVSSVSACLEKAEQMIGSSIDGVIVGVTGLHIVSQMSKGVVAVSKADNEITEDDVARAVEASRTIATPLNYEVLHVLPKNFSIDGQANIKDPVGMTGIRLEVDTHIILGSAAQIKNLTKAVYRAGLNIDDVVLSILATAEAVATKRQKELGVVVVNLGLSTTSVAVFEEGDVVHIAVLPIGSEHITNDIAIGLRTTIDIAEAVKVEYGDCLPGTVNKRDEVDLYQVGGPEHEMIKRYYISEIIEARMEEIIRKIDQELTKVKRSGLLPAGVIFTGGGAKLPGLLELSKKILRLPAVLGYPLGVESITDKVNDLGFSTAVGLVKWGCDFSGISETSRRPSKGMFTKVNHATSNIKKWMKALMP